MSELKPCPFCTGSAYVVSDFGEFLSVKCNNPICGGAVRLWGRREEAITAWNRRASPQAEDVRREALEWALAEIDVLSNRLVQFAYPQGMAMLGREDQCEHYIAARIASKETER